MTTRTKLATLTATVTLTTITLTGCGITTPDEAAGSTPEQALTSEWISTSEGDVSCLTSYPDQRYTSYECNWDTLTKTGTHTTEDSHQAEDAWAHTDQGEVFCIRNDLRRGYYSYSCDWDTLK